MNTQQFQVGSYYNPTYIKRQGKPRKGTATARETKRIRRLESLIEKPSQDDVDMNAKGPALVPNNPAYHPASMRQSLSGLTLDLGLPLNSTFRPTAKVVGVYTDDILVTNRVLFPDNHLSSEFKIGNPNQLQDSIQSKNLDLNRLYFQDDPLEIYEKLRRANDLIYGGHHLEDHAEEIANYMDEYYRSLSKDFVDVGIDEFPLV